MSQERRQSMSLILTGAGYGVILMILSVVSAGAGHGSYVPAMVSSAPLGLVAVLARVLGAPPMGPLTNATPALSGAPLVWACLGWLVGRSSTPKGRFWFLLASLCHYVSGVALIFTKESGGWSYLVPLHRAIPWLLPTWLTVYLGGHAWVWARYRHATG
jgi:hypothetical protein